MHFLMDIKLKIFKVTIIIYFKALKSVEDLFEFILLTFKRKKIFKTEDDFVKVISILAIT